MGGKNCYLVYLFIFLIATFFVAVKAENILVVVFASTKSHKLTYMPLIEELGKRGHNITVLSPIPATKPMKNVHEILTFDATKLKSFVADPFKMKEEKVVQHPFADIEYFTEVCGKTYDLPHVQALMKEKFDLIFTQPMINECAFGFMYRINAPIVFFSPVSAPGFLTERFGAYHPFSFIPGVFSDFPVEMNFYERFQNLGYEIWFRAFLKYKYYPAVQAVYHEKLGYDIPSIDEIYDNASLLLSNGHFSLHSPKPAMPDIVEVGGLHSRPAKPLPQHLEDFINKGNHGFIYFSMGSAIQGHTMSEEKRKIFLNTFAKLKQQVIWKWETESMPDLPPNVMLQKFLPQQDLLGHKSIKMFITHCGGGSTEESIYHAVPIIGLPMFADQPQNAKLARKHGFIIELDWNELTEEVLLEAIHEMLNNSTYKENVSKLSKIYKDQPEDPMTRAVYWVDYVLRHKGAHHLRSVGRKLPFYSYHSYDVILAYIAIIWLMLYVIYAVIRQICRCFKGSKSKNWKNKRE